MQTNDPSQQPPQFSLVLGGPLYHLYRRTRLAKDDLELLPRRIVVAALITWLPLLLLSLVDGSAFGGAMKIPFLYDIEAHVRFLIALPVLIAGELVVHRRISPMIRRFVDRRIVVAEDLPAFNASVEQALRVRNSVAVEVAQLVLVYTLGLWIWRTQIATGVATWYGMRDVAGYHFTPAGYWFAFVSIPLFQFILLRWYVRIGLWFWLLWRISRLNLHLTAAHPDRAGGIGFLGGSGYAFAPIVFAQGTLLSGVIASRVLYEGQNLMSFKMDAGGFIAFFVLFILGPLTMFSPQMDRAHRKGKAAYAALANRYVFGFEDKWLRAGADDSELLGAADIQSLADLGNSYSVVNDMRVVPFSIHNVVQLAATAAAPLVPLMLTMFSLEEVLTRLFKVVL